MPPFGGALFRGTGPCSSTIVRPAAKSVLHSCTHSVLPGHIHPWCVSANESVHLRVLLKREKKCRSALKTDNSPRGGLSHSLLRNHFLFHTHQKNKNKNKHWWWVIFLSAAPVFFVLFAFQKAFGCRGQEIIPPKPVVKSN